MTEQQTTTRLRLRSLGPANAFAVALLALATFRAAEAQAIPAQQPANIDVAVTYAASHSVHTGSADDFWLQGGAVQVNARFFRGLGLAASATGLHVKSNNPLVSPLDLVTITFGPRYTFFSRRRVSVFGEGLLGEAHGFHSLFAYGSGSTASLSNGITDSANSLALQAGGGVDIRLNSKVAIRAIQVDYLRTQLPNGGTNLQNNLGLGAGFDFQLGRKRSR